MASVTVGEEMHEVHVALTLQASTHMIGAKKCNALKCRVILPDMYDRSDHRDRGRRESQVLQY